MRITSDLNLNGTSPTRAQPRVGEWGPVKVPSTRFKKWQRVLVVLAFILVVVATVFVGRYFYKALTGDGEAQGALMGQVLVGEGAQVPQPVQL